MTEVVVVACSPRSRRSRPWCVAPGPAAHTAIDRKSTPPSLERAGRLHHHAAKTVST
eukprot:CAMPEP_0197389060 /NCGR_PEP_ID=MMETSP1165-20131217/1432_1 /TAXON_ID=284809 /ORGANISM="Chrysocystis fragilis, Strain CCMP3189" /LENGTH=56 /DNA_ID=CAMNT_0042914433 /DNA_START=283 /DNA_END=449 /DNA_ORIENTATION=-